MASARQSTSSTTESNEVLKAKFQGLHMDVVTALSSTIANILDFLFQHRVIGVEEMDTLHQKSSPRQQCRDLLTLLHKSKNPEAFVQLYLAIKNERHLLWLLDRIDQFTDPSVVTLVKNVYISKPTVGQVVHTLPEGEPVFGVTSLGDHVYLLRRKGGKDQIEVYDVITFSLKHCLSVPTVRGFSDMTSCDHFLCLYIGNHIAECIHRVDVQAGANDATRWPVNDKPTSLSVTADHNLLVTCRSVRKIKEFSSRGDLVCEITLPDDVINPVHAIQLSNGQYVVCHGRVGDAVHRVVVTSADGQQIVHTQGGQSGSSTDQTDVPARVLVDNNGFVFVVDMNNRRVKLLSPTLNYIRQVASPDQLKWTPDTQCLDVVRRRLYVADIEFKDGKFTAGRVVVFSV